MIHSRLELQAKRGTRPALLTQLDRLEVSAAVQNQPGFLGIDVLIALDSPDGVVVEGSWSSKEHFERWLENPVRDELLGKLRGLVATEPELRLFQLVDTIS